MKNTNHQVIYMYEIVKKSVIQHINSKFSDFRVKITVHS